MSVELSSACLICSTVGILAKQDVKLAQASGAPTCSNTPGPTLFLFLATELFVQQMTETEMPLTYKCTVLGSDRGNFSVFLLCHFSLHF